MSSELLGAIRRHPIWRSAADATVRALASRARDLRVKAGSAILSAGEPAQAIFLLIEGAVRVYYPATSKQAEITVKLFWAPAAFGDAESILRARWAETVEALTPCRVLVTDAAVYFKLLQRDPAVCFRQYWDVGRRFGVAIRSERAANFDELQDRIVALVAAYAQHFGTSDAEGGILIDHPLTQDSIAKQVGAKRRSVVAVLTRLYQDGRLERVGRRYRVPSLDALLLGATELTPALSFESDGAPWAER